MTPVVLQFATEAKLGSALIRWFTWSWASHVDIVRPDGTLLGARLNGGVQIRPADYARFTRTERYAVALNARAYERFWRYANAQIGQPYSQIGIVSFLLHDAQEFETRAAFDCSWFVAAAFQHAGMRLLRTDKAPRLTPRDLLLSPFLEPL